MAASYIRPPFTMVKVAMPFEYLPVATAFSRLPLAPAELPDDPAEFRTSYPEVLPRFEAARVGSGDRVEIARTVVAAAGERPKRGGRPRWG